MSKINARIRIDAASTADAVAIVAALEHTPGLTVIAQSPSPKRRDEGVFVYGSVQLRGSE